MTTQQELRAFILSTLNDDEGISSEAWILLAQYLQSAGETEWFLKLNRCVSSTDDRFYIAESANTGGLI